MGAPGRAGWRRSLRLRMGLRDGGVSPCLRPPRPAIHALQRQQLRRDRLRARGAGVMAMKATTPVQTIVPFNRPYMTGKELWNIAQAHNNYHLAGDGQFTRNC